MDSAKTPSTSRSWGCLCEGGFAREKTVMTSIGLFLSGEKNRSILLNERFQYSGFCMYFSTESSNFAVSQLDISLNLQRRGLLWVDDPKKRIFDD